MDSFADNSFDSDILEFERILESMYPDLIFRAEELRLHLQKLKYKSDKSKVENGGKKIFLTFEESLSIIKAGEDFIFAAETYISVIRRFILKNIDLPCAYIINKRINIYLIEKEMQEQERFLSTIKSQICEQ